jgi:hypothetical protein
VASKLSIISINNRSNLKYRKTLSIIFPSHIAHAYISVPRPRWYYLATSLRAPRPSITPTSYFPFACLSSASPRPRSSLSRSWRHRAQIKGRTRRDEAAIKDEIIKIKVKHSFPRQLIFQIMLQCRWKFETVTYILVN